MNTAGDPVEAADVWANAALASELFAVDPRGLGGVHLRAGAGPARDQVCSWVRDLSDTATPFVRVPLHVTDDRLLGGISLATTLREGRLVTERGLLACADRGVVILAMAERLESLVVSHVCSTLDRGELSIERDGLAATVPSRVGVIALDEGGDDEGAPQALLDRLAFRIDLSTLGGERTGGERGDARHDERLDVAAVRRARERLPDVEVGEPIIETLCQAAFALGVHSVRAAIHAVAAARAHAALEGRARATDVDAAVAARLVLGPRATRLPELAEPEPAVANASDEPGDAAPSPPPSSAPSPSPSEGEPTTALADTSGAAPEDSRAGASALDDVVLEAARSGIPSGLLDALGEGRAPRLRKAASGRSGTLQTSLHGGRPAGTRAGAPRTGERLNLVETLRAAVPWQRLRRRARGARGASGAAATRRPVLVEVRKEDFRVTHFRKRTATTVIFAVDASGSAALQRLAEAKGAVEQVLSDCYARRDHVALIAFRGTAATLLLPPTRSLARVRRHLADLAGGGTTPLATGIDAALTLALEARRQDKTPLLVLMTDGRANVARAGNERSAAASDALASGRAVRAAGVCALVLDTSPRPRAEARLIATEMGARYLPLPYLDAVGISREVQLLAGEAR